MGSISTNDWALLIKAGKDEMESFAIGKKVQLTFANRPIGIIIGQDEPYGLLAPKYHVQWDDGSTGKCSSSDLILL